MFRPTNKAQSGLVYGPCIHPIYHPFYWIALCFNSRPRLGLVQFLGAYLGDNNVHFAVDVDLVVLYPRPFYRPLMRWYDGTSLLPVSVGP